LMFAPRTLAMGIVSSVFAGRAVYTGKVGAVSTAVRRRGGGGSFRLRTTA